MFSIRFSTIVFRVILGGTGFLFCPDASAAPSDKDKLFLAERNEIILLTLERVRVAHSDYQRAIKMGEARIRELHENYKIAKSTPPTKLASDSQELKNAVLPVRLRRGRGRVVSADPKAAPLIEKYWQDYELGFERIRQNIPAQRALGKSDSQVYWGTMQAHADLQAKTEEKLIFNAPGGRSMDEVLQKNEWALLKEAENPASVKTKKARRCVTAPEEHPRQTNVDIAPFYHSQSMLPTISPKWVLAFEVPVDCRTVTKRETGLKVIVRVSKGKGVAYIGSSEAELSYGYVMIPPDTAYYFENTMEEPLQLEAVAIPQ